MANKFSIKDFLNYLQGKVSAPFKIDSREKLAEAASVMGILPFFPNNIRGLSVEEMCAPGMLFGGNYDEGCWEWKGPVVRKREAAYGKFFLRKAGFVSIDLLPDFLNYRRNAYPVKEGTIDEMLLEIIKENDSLTSTQLRQLIFGGIRRRRWDDLPDNEVSHPEMKRKSLEGPLQRLQMGGWIVISDFEYKRTKKGERYGWGVARYSTPELTFPDMEFKKNKSGLSSMERIISDLSKRYPGISKESLNILLK